MCAHFEALIHSCFKCFHLLHFLPLLLKSTHFFFERFYKKVNKACEAMLFFHLTNFSSFLPTLSPPLPHPAFAHTGLSRLFF